MKKSDKLSNGDYKNQEKINTQYEPICIAITAVASGATSFYFLPVLSKEQKEQFRSMSYPENSRHTFKVTPWAEISDLQDSLSSAASMNHEDSRDLAQFLQNSVDYIANYFHLTNVSVKVTIKNDSSGYLWHYDVDTYPGRDRTVVRLGIELMGGKPTEFSIENNKFSKDIAPEKIYKPEFGHAAIWRLEGEGDHKAALHRAPQKSSDDSKSKRLLCIFDLKIPNQQLAQESLQNILSKLRENALTYLANTSSKIAEKSISAAIENIEKITEIAQQDRAATKRTQSWIEKTKVSRRNNSNSPSL